MPDVAEPQPRILITNDDGIEAEGLRVLARVANELSQDVWTCAPISEASGVGHGMTLHRPLRIRRLGPSTFTVDGTPTDCVLLAINDLLGERKPDLVLSGVNHGSNIGDDVTYSGTIGGAMEATLLGIPAVALSLATDNNPAPYWASVEMHAPGIIRQLMAEPWPSETLFSINFPNCPAEQVRGVRVLRHGTRKIGDEITHHRDPRGRQYTWIGAARSHAKEPEHDADVSIIEQNFITVTPLHMDLTNHAVLERYRQALDTDLAVGDEAQTEAETGVS
jgi:5'-nucleotidase